MTRRRDDRQSALDAAVESIEREGGEFDGPKLVKEILTGRPANEPVWLTPGAAGINYRQVWTVRTASGAEVRVLTTRHRRAGSTRRAIDTNKEVRIVKVLQGSGIGT